jgi:hypothetical protein
MRPMTPKQAYAHAQAFKRVQAALAKLDKLDDAYRTNENIEVARARLEEWLDDERGRWVA